MELENLEGGPSALAQDKTHPLSEAELFHAQWQL